MGETTTAPEPSSNALGEAIEIGGHGVNVHDGTSSPDSGGDANGSEPSLGSAGTKIAHGCDQPKEVSIYPKIDADSKVTGDMVYDVSGDAKVVFSASNEPSPAKQVSPVRDCSAVIPAPHLPRAASPLLSLPTLHDPHACAGCFPALAAPAPLQSAPCPC